MEPTLKLRPLTDASEADEMWRCANEFPQFNFDDSGPSSPEEFREEIAHRMLRQERIWKIVYGDRIAGYIGFMPVTERLGSFHGICLFREFHRMGIGRRSVEIVSKQLFSEGVEKIMASFFANNPAIYCLFMKIGAIQEGYFTRQTTQNGVPIDMRCVALFKEES